MNKQQNTRWQQRFDNYQHALSELQTAVEMAHSRKLNKLEILGLIKFFGYTHELAWNTLKDFFTERGAVKMYGSRDTTRLAFKEGLIEQGEIWMNMIASRNLAYDAYQEEVAQKLYENIINQYYSEFKALELVLKNLGNKSLDSGSH
ncbi:nucleotidyltransferase substrate binding protein [Endozoicomonas sp. 4G]|uniref:nucleotidyltransferase substrate binding protein n=1 Tax=Endozoicomonas sp. 4G TaxID=2872754 RepID=UPI0020784F67|nr:nucleotidyltransferase substrate binding protein [Endozoicomonas sp. 4G]